MALRPSLARVVPGSVPPWRALCAESARALKAFLLARFLGQGLLPARGPRAAGPRRSFCGLAAAPPSSAPMGVAERNVIVARN